MLSLDLGFDDALVRRGRAGGEQRGARRDGDAWARERPPHFHPASHCALEHHGRRVRALQPLSPDDSRLLAAVNRGEFVINGFRNRDLRVLLYGAAEVTATELKRQSARTTRQIRMLRAHGLIRKISKTHRYTLTSKGRLTINAILAAQQASSERLAQLAA